MSPLRTGCRFALALTGVALLTAPALGDIIVLATSDPWLAGMPDGTNASINDFAPGQSPVLVTGLLPGNSLTFTVSGSASNTPFPSGLGPDGGGYQGHATGAENGISDALVPINALVGVFLDNSQPDSSAAPGALDFSNLDFASLSPGLKQVFFIGDGLTSGAVAQQFVVPAGAARLYLGTMDGFEWNNNTGGFSVGIGGLAVPEPGVSALLAASGIPMLFILRRRKARK